MAPTAAENLPASQLMQTEEPSLSEYLPSRQDVQVAASEIVDPTGPYLPAAHKEPEQLEGVVAPTTTENLPDSQSMQTEEPTASENLPAPQTMHMLEKFAPVVVEYLPAVQSVHLEEPETGLYLPATQLVQTVEAVGVEYLPA